LANAPVELSVDVFAAVVVVSVRVDRPNIVTTFAIAALTGRVEPDLPGRLPAGGRRNVETDRTRTPARTTDERAERRRGRTRDAGGREPSRERDEATVPSLDAEDERRRRDACGGV
jgi:hypothetical protein